MLCGHLGVHTEQTVESHIIHRDERVEWIAGGHGCSYKWAEQAGQAEDLGQDAINTHSVH